MLSMEYTHIYEELPIKSDHIFTPQPLRAPGYCRTPSGRAGGRADKPR